MFDLRQFLYLTYEIHGLALFEYNLPVPYEI